MTFAQQRNRLTTHCSERIPVVKRRICAITFRNFANAPKIATVVAVSSFRVVSIVQMDMAVLIGSSRGFECAKKRHFYWTLMNSSHSGRSEIKIKLAKLHEVPCLCVPHPKHQLQSILNCGTYVTNSCTRDLDKLIIP
jgi:hypothetical protein